jgi:2,3-bisphosphoglycerate-independent phosphoglycerate mutase
MQTARFLNAFADLVHKVLEEDPVNVKREQRGEPPANFLLMRDAGTKMPKVKSDGSMRFTESYAKRGSLGKIMHGYEVLRLLTKMC